MSVYTELDPAGDPADLAARLSDRVNALATRGADAVTVQATDGAPDPRPLLEALARHAG